MTIEPSLLALCCAAFHILGDSTDTLFSVSTAGVVSAVGVLDRETLDFHMINVLVCKSCSNT